MAKPPSSTVAGGSLDGMAFSEADLLELPLVTRATLFAAWMHRKQKRKYGGAEYIRHPMTVATTVGALGAGAEAYAAALLHDTVEDTAATPELVARLFGPVVSGWVVELTSPEFTDKAARIEFFRKHIAALSLTATQIKLADRLSNLLDCNGADAKFKTRYTAEALVIVEAVQPQYRADPAVVALSERIRTRVAVLAAELAEK